MAPWDESGPPVLGPGACAAPPNRSRFARECDVLAERFLKLASRFQGAVRPLRTPGSLPTRPLLDELVECRRDFLSLRDEARHLARMHRLPCPGAEEIEDLHSLAILLDDLSEAEVHPDPGEESRHRALTVL